MAALGAVPLAAQGRGDHAARIGARRAASNRAIAAHDTAGLATIFAPQVVVVSSNSTVISGRDANAMRFAEQFRTRPDVIYRRTPEAVFVYGPWRMASERGRWTGSWTDTDGRVALVGHYFAKWREISGEWYVESETYVPERCTGGAYCRTVP
ncbi:MAG: nuclear transport factor 2 family protein [Gemmatimonadaceae bacterium]|jgi:ketosteroid isomerase-like protein|nr:nuclear transport factor 2 family protein [Gemmatimonadaceae bacterium]